jgi:hypothetical protein
MKSFRSGFLVPLAVDALADLEQARGLPYSDPKKAEVLENAKSFAAGVSRIVEGHEGRQSTEDNE